MCSVHEGLFFILPLSIFFFFFWIMCPFVSVFTGNSKSCGLPPECNIHCYVLDVSMPKHTMHCSPDLVTVFPRPILHTLFNWLCCGQVNPGPTSAVFPSWHVHVSSSSYSCPNMCVVIGCAWLKWKTICPNQIPQKKLKNKFKKTVVNENFQSTVAILFGHFSVCCYCMYCINVAFIERCDCF